MTHCPLRWKKYDFFAAADSGLLPYFYVLKSMFI